MRAEEVVDRLEYLVQHARRVPFSNQVMLDEDELLEMLQQLRVGLPQEIKEASRTVAEHERLIKEAHAEAGRILARANQRAETAVQESEVLHRARREAERTLSEARTRADQVVREAEAYALEQLRQLETTLTRTLGTVKRGVELLQRKQLGADESTG
jgi:cell division septum initiation protein DivIVA